MRVAAFNLHAGVDGWGRPTQVLPVLKDLDADILILPELWRGDDGVDFYDDLSTSLNMSGNFAPLARGERVTTGQGDRRWQPRLAHFVGERGLYFQEHRTLTTSQTGAREQVQRLEPGTWGPRPTHSPRDRRDENHLARTVASRKGPTSARHGTTA